jgi:CxxC motif-containing protein (DUF1111 family)
VRALLVAIAASAWLGCRSDTEPVPPSDDEALSGGRATVFDASRMAYAQAAPGLTAEHETEFFVGNAIFNRGWIAAPASVEQFDGLGPTFNATNCSACHFKDGRGRPPVEGDERFLSLLLRLSIPGRDEHGGPIADPVYGAQLQGFAIAGVPAEGREEVSYEESVVTTSDGERISLRAPTYRITELGYGSLAPNVMVSPRVARAVFGLGLLEAVDETTILANADPDDRDGNGISGRPNYAWDVRRKKRMLGRFGWKAAQTTIEQQVASAFNADMGITSSLFPDGDCTAAQKECVGALSGGAPELDDKLLASIVTYSKLLAVPARRHWNDPAVVHGKATFVALGCSGCHRETMKTADVPEFPELSHQTIHPYSDLLLHDMGARLADDRPDFEADGSEWRTPPLWGIGLVKVVNRHTFFLHDGRARSLLEAIAWHGGEAAGVRAKFLALTKGDRDAVLAFLDSL